MHVLEYISRYIVPQSWHWLFWFEFRAHLLTEGQPRNTYIPAKFKTYLWGTLHHEMDSSYFNWCTGAHHQSSGWWTFLSCCYLLVSYFMNSNARNVSRRRKKLARPFFTLYITELDFFTTLLFIVSIIFLLSFDNLFLFIVDCCLLLMFIWYIHFWYSCWHSSCCCHCCKSC